MESLEPWKPEPQDKSEIGQQEFPQQMQQRTSLYSLTLDEIQNTVLEPGKMLGSMDMDMDMDIDMDMGMDMDELLAIIWSTEEGDDFATTATVAAIPHQEASLDQQQAPPRPSSKRAPTLDCQLPLDKMTLEDFFGEAGIVEPANWPSVAATPELEAHVGFYEEGGRMGYGYGSVGQNMGSPMNPDGGVMMAMQAEGTRAGRKRPAAEVTVEMVKKRRERKLIKNRQSSANSRARKQAYTEELEDEINQLTEQNRLLEKELLKHMFVQDPNDAAKGSEVEFKTMGVRRCSSCTW